MFVLILHHIVWGGTPHISSAPTQGHPSPGRSASSLLRGGERPCDTLKAHPENTARHLGEPSMCGGAVSSERDIRVPEAKRGRVPL